MADWVQVAVEIAAAAIAFIAGYASLRADQGALKDRMAAQEDRHVALVDDISLMKSKMGDEFARLSVAIERLAGTMERLEFWLELETKKKGSSESS
jgi:hypothetical protein